MRVGAFSSRNICFILTYTRTIMVLYSFPVECKKNKFCCLLKLKSVDFFLCLQLSKCLQKKSKKNITSFIARRRRSVTLFFHYRTKDKDNPCIEDDHYMKYAEGHNYFKLKERLPFVPFPCTSSNDAL